jgi:integrase/recombinase XerD
MKNSSLRGQPLRTKDKELSQKALQRARSLAKVLSKENSDPLYLREVLYCLRKELNLSVSKEPLKLPQIPTEDEIKRYYEAVWQSRNMKHVVLIKTLLYTGVKVSELIHIKLDHIDFNQCQIKIVQKKEKKERIVPFPHSFKELLAMYANTVREKKGEYLLESSQKKPYSDRGIRKILSIYTKAAGIDHSISPMKLRYFLFTWVKKQGIDYDFIQAYSGHNSLGSLEIYRKLSIAEGQEAYNTVIDKFPV